MTVAALVSILSVGVFVASYAFNIAYVSLGNVQLSAITAALCATVMPLLLKLFERYSTGIAALWDGSVGNIWRALDPRRQARWRYPLFAIVIAAASLPAWLYGFTKVHRMYAQTCAGAQHLSWHDPLGEHREECQVKQPIALWAPHGEPLVTCLYAADEFARVAAKTDDSTIVCPQRTSPPLCSADMILVPAGTFHMGSSSPDALELECLASLREPETCKLHAKRQNDRHADKQTSAFCMDTHEVTYAQLLKVLGDGGRSHVSKEVVNCSGVKYELGRVSDRGAAMLAPTGGFTIRDGMLQLLDASLAAKPAAGISWSMALEYCRSQKKRLPTDIEWEYAARGPESRAYVSGERASWTHEDFGCPPANANGLGVRDPRCDTRREPPKTEEDKAWSGVFSLAGSVNEWTSTQAGNDCKQGADCRIVKGGSHEDPGFFTRPATVFYARGDCPWSTIGFRCASDPAQFTR